MLCIKTFVAAFAVTFVSVVSIGTAYGSMVTGSPVDDGWTALGHSLSNGVYSRGSANYGFEIYGAALTVAAGSNLEISNGSYSWLAGDTVLGVGGVFSDITATEAGWGAIGGNAVNSLLSQDFGPKLIAKFGTATASYDTSTLAPGSGDGNGSTAAGGDGTVFVRTSGWFHATDPLQSQDSDTTWSGNSGQLMELDKATHISRVDTSRPDTAVARVIWQYDADLNNPISWQILLNVSLLDRTAPGGFSGLTPAAGDLTVVSVQDRDSAYTDAVVVLPAAAEVIPEPGSLVVWSLLAVGAGLVRFRRQRLLRTA